MIESPFFLVGSERSGTTLLRLMLSHHPEISWCEEFEYSVIHVEDTGKFPELSKYCEWLETDRIFQSTGFTIDNQLTYPELVNSFLEQRQNQEQKAIIGATVHRHFNRLLYIWPNARFIHILRDPRDVARSCIGMGWAGNVWTGVAIWETAELLWNDFVKKLTPDRYIEIKYENLISQTEETLELICEFIGVNYNPIMLSYANNSTYDAPDSSLINQWKKKLSDYEVQLIESRVGELLVDRGYELSGLPQLNIKDAEIKKLKSQDYWYKVNFRVKRYGLYLFVTDYLSRKFKLKNWQKQIKLTMNDISASYLK